MPSQKPDKVFWVGVDETVVYRIYPDNTSIPRLYEPTVASRDRLMRLACAPSQGLVVMWEHRGYLFVLVRKRPVITLLMLQERFIQ